MSTEAVLPLDGKEVEGQVATQLAYLSKLANHLGIVDPVEEYFAPVIGRWSDLHAEADRWRLVGASVEQVTEALNTPLGKLDAAWDGEAAESFISYMQRVGLAGNDMADAMTAMADVLDQTANAIREIVVELAGVMAETAETASESMVLPVQGDTRTREYLELMRRPSKELFEAVRGILEAFVELCEGAEGDETFRKVTMAHLFPEENWAVPGAPAVPAPGTPVDTSTTMSEAGAGGLGAGGFGGGGAGGGGVGGLGGGAAAASAGPLAAGNYTVAGEQAPSTNAPPAAAAAAGAGGAGKPRAGGGMPMMPMMPMGGQGQGGDADHKNRSRVVGNPSDIFGKPAKASTPVIGSDD